MKSEIKPAADYASVKNLALLNSKGRPETAFDLQARIADYFTVVGEGGLFAGIESLSYALSIDRTTFWRWASGFGLGRDLECQEICKQARQSIVTMLEQAVLAGAVPAPTGIFLLKNYGYSDNPNLDFQNKAMGASERKTTQSVRDLPRFNIE